jgi:hypothetical protein
MATALERQGHSAAAARETSELLFCAANGIANRAADAEALSARIARLVSAVVADA